VFIGSSLNNSYISSGSVLTSLVSSFWVENIGGKSALKMLVKLIITKDIVYQ
jgi:hypothetical protein